MKVLPLVLAGGQGKRLQPFSTEDCPKQFLPLLHSGASFFQDTITGLRRAFKNETIVVSTYKNYVDFVKRQCEQINEHNYTIISEEVVNNTFSPIAITSILGARSGNTTMLAIPTDLFVEDKYTLIYQLQMSCLMSYLKHQHITFGVKPTEASSKYGYVKLKTSKSIDDMFYQPSISDKNKHKILFDCYEVESFFEKPDFNEACYFLQTRQYLWNSGMYIFDIKTLQQEMKKLHPDVFDAVVEHFFAYNSEVIIADENILKQIPNLSVDNAVSIYSKNLNCCCAKFDWQDIGHLDNLMMMLVYNKIDVDAVLRCYQKSSSKVVSL